MAATIATGTSVDFLIRDVGRELMPEVKGYTHVINLHDSILTDDDFSIRDIVKTTLKILNRAIDEKKDLLDRQNFYENRRVPIYKAILNTPAQNKRIILYDMDNKEVAVSPFVSSNDDLYFNYNGVSYFQSGYRGSIYFRRLL